MTQTLSLEDGLLDKIVKGDEFAFRILFNEQWSRVYSTSLRITKDSEKAEDLAQEVFIKIWQQRNRLADVVNINGYIYTVTRNLALDFLRKKIFTPENMDYLVDYFISDKINPQELVEFKELNHLMDSAMKSLTGKVAEVFHLSRSQGLTHEEIAQKLGISVVTSKTYVVRALQTIRKYMADNSDAKILLLAASIICY